MEANGTDLLPRTAPNKKRPLAVLAKWPFFNMFLVGIAGFEPTTSASRRLVDKITRYIPRSVWVSIYFLNQ